MGKISAIEWTDSTWNPWHGCIKVSPGCKNCYMYSDKKRYGQDPIKVVRSKPATFNAPLKWKEPRRVFTCSWSDFFIEEADAWRDDAWEIIRKTPQHTYQILTKRPERIAAHLPDDWGNGWPNVYLGISAEDHRHLEARVGDLMGVKSVVRFISAEPLLGPINFEKVEHPLKHPKCDFDVYLKVLSDFGGNNGIHWVIVGGESGPGYRQINPDWARSIRDQCKAAGVPFFMKQMSGIKSKMQPIPEDLQIREMPTIQTGRN